MLREMTKAGQEKAADKANKAAKETRKKHHETSLCPPMDICQRRIVSRQQSNMLTDGVSINRKNSIAVGAVLHWLLTLHFA